MAKFKKIAVVDTLKIEESAKKELQNYSEEPIIFPETDTKNDEEVIERIGDADAILGSWLTTINKNILKKTPNLKYIGICGTNMAHVDLKAVEEGGVTIKNVVDYGDEPTAEYIFSQLLMLIRGFGKYQWREEPAELNGKTIGIVGLGAVGKHVARVALGFNMNVLYNSLKRKPDWEEKGLKYCELHELLKSSDIISLHVPKNLVILKEEEFNLIPKGTILVDTCLGVVFDVEAFKRWIGKKENFVIFDYSKKEPFDKIGIPDNVMGVGNVIAGMTAESRERLSQKVLDNIKSFEK